MLCLACRKTNAFLSAMHDEHCGRVFGYAATNRMNAKVVVQALRRGAFTRKK